MCVSFRGDADFCTTCLFLDPSTQPFLWSRARIMLVTERVQEALPSKEIFLKLNVKRNLNVGLWDRIRDSLYQIQTMQPKDLKILTGRELSLYQGCSKYFERVIAVQDIHWNWIRHFLSAQLSWTICLPNTGSQLRAPGQRWTQKATSLLKGWLLIS